MESEAEQKWLCDKHQEVKQQPLDDAMKRSLALEMLRSQAFDNFLATKFQSVKRCEVYIHMYLSVLCTVQVYIHMFLSVLCCAGTGARGRRP